MPRCRPLVHNVSTSIGPAIRAIVDQLVARVQAFSAAAAATKPAPLDLEAVAQGAMSRSRDTTPRERTPVAQKVRKMNQQHKAVGGGPVAPRESFALVCAETTRVRTTSFRFWHIVISLQINHSVLLGLAMV